MLGEKVGQETGKVSVRRVLATEGNPKLEVSFQSSGKLLGVEHRNMCTYVATLTGDGITHGEGQGIATGRNGEVAKWKGHRAGRLKGDGSVSYRGMVQYEVSPRSGTGSTGSRSPSSTRWIQRGTPEPSIGSGSSIRLVFPAYARRKGLELRKRQGKPSAPARQCMGRVHK